MNVIDPPPRSVGRGNASATAVLSASPIPNAAARLPRREARSNLEGRGAYHAPGGDLRWRLRRFDAIDDASVGEVYLASLVLAERPDTEGSLARAELGQASFSSTAP